MCAHVLISLISVRFVEVFIFIFIIIIIGTSSFLSSVFLALVSSPWDLFPLFVGFSCFLALIKVNSHKRPSLFFLHDLKVTWQNWHQRKKEKKHAALIS